MRWNGIRRTGALRRQSLGRPEGLQPYAHPPMNAWLQAIGLAHWKIALVPLLLPPVPFLLVMLAGAAVLRRSLALGWAGVAGGALALYASLTPVGADWATRVLLDPPLPVREPQTLVAPAPAQGRTWIVVLGGGRTPWVEYTEASLSAISMERLRYGIWLGRETGAPIFFSGGLSPGSRGGPTEAALARRIAREEFRHPIDAVEDMSFDTRTNAVYTTRVLGGADLGRLVLVTHQSHMPRALRHFVRERDLQGLAHEIVAAPMGVQHRLPVRPMGDYLPSGEGIARFRYAVREWLGILAGA